MLFVGSMIQVTTQPQKSHKLAEGVSAPGDETWERGQQEPRVQGSHSSETCGLLWPTCLCAFCKQFCSLWPRSPIKTGHVLGREAMLWGAGSCQLRRQQLQLSPQGILQPKSLTAGLGGLKLIQGYQWGFPALHWVTNLSPSRFLKPELVCPSRGMNLGSCYGAGTAAHRSTKRALLRFLILFWY